MITIYGLTNSYGNICYVGMTSDPHNRFRAHSKTYRALNVSGFAVLATTLCQREARKIESQWIEFLGKDNLHNGNGGGGGDVMGSSCTQIDIRPGEKQTIFNFKLPEEYHRFIAQTAKAQGHGNKSLVIKKLLDREMSAA